MFLLLCLFYLLYLLSLSYLEHFVSIIQFSIIISLLSEHNKIWQNDLADQGECHLQGSTSSCFFITSSISQNLKSTKRNLNFLKTFQISVKDFYALRRWFFKHIDIESYPKSVLEALFTYNQFSWSQNSALFLYGGVDGLLCYQRKLQVIKEKHMTAVFERKQM